MPDEFAIAGKYAGLILDLDGCLGLIFENKPVPPLFVETWTPTENNRPHDIAVEADWLRRSVQNLCARLRTHGAA